MTRLSCSIFCIALSLLQAHAAPEGSDGLNRLRGQFTSISSLDISGVYTLESYKEDGTHLTGDTVRVHIREQGKQTWFESETIKSVNWPSQHSIVAYDGEVGQCYDSLTQVLILKKDYIAPSTLTADFFNPLAQLVPFYPLARRDDMFHITRLTDFTDTSIWQASLAGISLDSSTAPTASSLLHFKSTYWEQFIGNNAADLRVSLDPATGYLPTTWSGWVKGNQVSSYETLAWQSTANGNGRSFYFPKKTKIIIYFADGPGKGKPSIVSTFELTSLSINKTYTKDDFAVDPGIASYIWDRNAPHQPWVAVPK